MRPSIVSTIILCIIPISFWSGCTRLSHDGAVMLPNERIAYPASSVRLGDTAWVTAEALRVDKRTNRLYVYAAAPTFPYAVNSANIAIRRNNKGFDVDMSANTDWFLPIDKPENVDEIPVVTVNAPLPTHHEPVLGPPTIKDEKK